MVKMDRGFENALTKLIHRQSQIVHTRMAGRAVIRVVRRCNDAMEDQTLDLSDCQLMTVPDAIYHLLRSTSLTACNLSTNELSRITPKFITRFSHLRELNLSHNKMTRLPDEMAVSCQALERLDISHNLFVNVPSVVFSLNKLKLLVATDNDIFDVDVSLMSPDSELEEADLRNNPLLPACHEVLSQSSKVLVKLSARQLEDWEDLNI